MEAVQAVGNIVQGIGGYQAGLYNKRVNYAQAQEEEMAGEAEAGRLREQARAAIGEQLAAQFSGGLEGGTGSAIDNLAQSQINATLDAMQLHRDAAMKARSLRAKGDQAKTEGTFALISGVLQAGGKAYSAQQDWAAARRGTTPAGNYGGSDITVTRGGPLPSGY
jgi:hypothetical protein